MSAIRDVIEAVEEGDGPTQAEIDAAKAELEELEAQAHQAPSLQIKRLLEQLAQRCRADAKPREAFAEHGAYSEAFLDAYDRWASKGGGHV